MRHFVFYLLVIGCLPCAAVFAQQPGAPRPLAPGVLKIVPAEVDSSDSQSIRMPLPDLDAPQYEPNEFAKSRTLYGSTRDIVFFRDVFQYEFAYLGLRQLELDVPGKDRELHHKTVWYLVYRIRNTGKTVSYDKVVDEVVGTVQHEIVYDREKLDPSVMEGRFFPIFNLVAWVEDPSTGAYVRSEHIDKILPTVVSEIQLEEDPNRLLYDSVEISRHELPLSQGDSDGGVWGVAVWDDIDPRVDYLSIRIQGITNGQRIVNNLDGTKSFQTRELQLNFYRPGDTLREVDDRVSSGVPLVDSPKEQAAIALRYELPGPLFKVYEQVNDVESELRLRADGQVDLDTFVSPLALTLNDGKLPAPLRDALNEVGIPVTAETPVDKLVVGQKWKFSIDSRVFTIYLQPQFWEPFGEGARLIKPLDYAWIYR